MKEVGDKFGSGELILPFVLQSAEVMKKAVAQLENYLEKKADVSKGRVVLATVYGDVHDIGKNLVKTILSNNGYTVFDLGKQVPVQTILAKAQEVGADAIGLSALLVSTSKLMPACVAELHRAGLAYPVLIGGAAINRNFGRRAALLGDDQVYEPGVYYCKDAFEGLDTMNALMDPEQRVALVERVRREALEFRAKAPGLEARAAASAAQQGDFRVKVARAAEIPVPPFWGTRVTPTGEVSSCLRAVAAGRGNGPGGTCPRQGTGDHHPGSSAACLAGRSQNGAHLGRVAFRLHPRPGPGDPPVWVHQEGGAQDPHGGTAVADLLAPGTPCVGRGVVLVRQEHEGQAEPGPEAGVAGGIVRADSPDDRPVGLDVRPRVPELAGLGRAAGRVVLRVEVHDRPAAALVGQAVDGTALIG